MKLHRADILRKIKETVHAVETGAEVILYGSEARGDAREHSDIDILILIDRENLSFEEKQAITNPLYDLELETGVLISPMVLARKQWDERPFKTPFYIHVINEGITL